MTVGTWRTVSVNGSVGEVVVTMLGEAGPYRASARVSVHTGEAESTCARLAVFRALANACVLSELAEVLPPGVPSRAEALEAMRAAVERERVVTQRECDDFSGGWSGSLADVPAVADARAAVDALVGFP